MAGEDKLRKEETRDKSEEGGEADGATALSASKELGIGMHGVREILRS